MEEDILICRCKEVTKAEIIEAIKDGATTIDGVKRRTKAGMGLCQGKTCERLVAKIISEQTGIIMEELIPATKRIPVRPIKIGIIGGSDDE
ncbi:MAG: (2Fe-2S)-binding protein [Intestinibacter bartlettii]|uniref:(2Fe-2S)-binding protein n=1 Tax=Intestinibacter bartlettii TaxID=261299 RepID=UPI0026EDC6F2|nr:(2Fe-2S)-binding protein [Intestinibacter bartlettii]MDO5010047.1 (2Fe-2S)-binding protein [Intestinibacter bartlettii]